MTHIEELREVIHKLHGGKATHRESVPVKEEFNGETVWDGIVEVFHLAGHPKTDTVYAWLHDTGDPEQPSRHVTVLRIHPHSHRSQPSSLSSYRSSEMPKQQKPEPKKPGRPKLSEADAKGKIVPVRFKADDLEKIAKAAKKNKQTVSEWIRSTLATAIEGRI